MQPNTAKIGKRLFVIYLIIAGLVAAAGWMSLDASRQMSTRANELVAVQLPQLSNISALQNSVNEHILRLYLYYSSAEPTDWQRFTEQKTVYPKHFADLADKHSASNKTANSEHVERIKVLIDNFHQQAALFQKEMSKGEDRDWDELRRRLALAQSAANVLTNDLADWADELRSNTTAVGRRTSQQLERVNTTQTLVLGVLFCVSLVVMAMLRLRLKDQAQVAQRALRDNLTGLPNEQQLELDWAVRHDAECPSTNQQALLMVSLDRYQLLTSTFGHHFAAELRQAVSKRLKTICSEFSVPHELYQIAPETWLLMFDRPPPPANIVSTAHLFLDSIDQAPLVVDRELKLSCSAGLAIYPQHGDNVHELLPNVNSALQRARTDGGNQLIVYDPRIQVQTEQFLHMEQAIRQAIANDEFELFYQPKLNAGDLTCAGAEALLRWRRNGELISPGEFIPVAEESGLILPLGQWVLNEACRQWKRWLQEGLSAPHIAVNVSAQQFQSEGFVETLRQALSENGVPPSLLELEITEEATFDDPQNVIDTMHRIKATGASLAIDDFGTGYSSLSYLSSFPLDVIKIDQKFIAAMESSTRDMSIVELIVGLGKKMGFKVVAEGVEEQGQEDLLRELGCDFLQGYLYSRPVPAADYALYLRSHANATDLAKGAESAKAQTPRVSKDEGEAEASNVRSANTAGQAKAARGDR